MTRDEFEAATWQALASLQSGRRSSLEAVDAILGAADAFAATTAATALEVNGKTHRPPSVHYLGTSGQPACGYGRGMADPALTSDPGQVTCGACKRTAGHRRALALAVAS